MSKLKVTTVNTVRKMEEQTAYSYPLNTNKNSCAKEVDEHVLNSTMEGSIVQEPVKQKTSQPLELSDMVTGKCSNCASSLGAVLLYALDFFINVGSNEWVRNVIIVFLTVCLEVFVVMVLAASTVLTTIIVNIDDAYKTYGKAKERIEFGEGSTSSRGVNENLNCKRTSKDASFKEEKEIEDVFRLEGRLSSEDVIDSFATKLSKNNKLLTELASEN